MTSHERHIFGDHVETEHENVHRAESGATLELREEELAARKRAVEAGRVSIDTEVVEEERTLEVPVTREEVTIERRSVNRQPADEPISGSAEMISVPVHEEQVLVEKQPVVYEEVHLGKREVQETQRVSGTTRKEVVDVDATGDARVHGQQLERD